MGKSEDYVLTEIIGQIKNTGISYYLQRDIYKANKLIEESLKKNPSKMGGVGGGIPDVSLLFRYDDEQWVIFIE